MEKNYNHHDESQTYAKWQKSGDMRANANSKKPPFVISLPPPNVTGELHLGHAAMLAIEDILIRFRKMNGSEVLWVPGTDHAAIATESVVIKHLKLKNREELSRDQFLEACRAFATEKHDNIVDQIKKMGSWLDWSREAYTFDEARNTGVIKIFTDLYKDGLITRGHRIINWSTKAQSVLADDELEWEEKKESFYYLRCGRFVVGTVRSETKCSDSPVIVNAKGKYVLIINKAGDELILSDHSWKKEKSFAHLRKDYQAKQTMSGKDLVGEKFEADTYAGKRNFWVIADDVIDMTKGTGAMTISAAHSEEDYELAKRLKLDELFFEKIDKTGHMTELAGPCQDMIIAKARIESGKIMQQKGLLISEDKDYIHRVPLCYRTQCVVEPMISQQWFISVNKEFVDRWTGKKTTLKKLTAEAVKQQKVKIIPAKFEKTYFQWIDNLRDWCVSRQIWWGHQIPIWHDQQGGTFLPKETKVFCVRHGKSEDSDEGRIQRPDTPLTEQGKKEVEAIARKLKQKNITLIITSQHQRAKETAAIVAQHCGAEIVDAPELNGVDTGVTSGEKISDIYDIEKETLLEYCERHKTGENRSQIWNRVKAGWQKTKDLSATTSGNVALVSHRTIFSTLDGIISEKSPDSIVENRKRNEERANASLWCQHTIFSPPQNKGELVLMRHGESEGNQKKNTQHRFNSTNNYWQTTS